MPESRKPSVRLGEDYSLYVTNLPEELNEDGITKVFKEYGKVKAIIAPRSGQFAFISYATYTEAENAIASLDGKPPLYLRVQFRRKKKESVAEEYEYQQGLRSGELPAAVPLLMEQDRPPKSSSTYSSQDSRVELLRTKFAPQEYSIAPSYAMMSSDLVHCPYERIEYPDSNAVWSRGTITVDAAGRRHVTMGRGHISYNISEPRPRIMKDIAKIYEIRQAGQYRYGSDQCKDYYGECIHCLRDATLCCSVCEGFYCSRACQTADWPKHQEQCGKIPPLVDATCHQDIKKTDANIGVSPGQFQKVVEEKQPKKMTLRRPKSVIDSSPGEIETPETPATSPAPSQTQRENTLRRIEKPLRGSGELLPNSKLVEPIRKPVEPIPTPAETIREPGELISNSKPTGPIRKPGGPVLKPAEPIPKPVELISNSKPAEPIRKPVAPVELISNSKPAEPIRKPVEPIPKPAVKNVEAIPSQSIHDNHAIALSNADNFLSTDFTEVLITSIQEPGKILSVQKIEDSDKITELMAKLNAGIQQCPSVVNPAIGEIYGVIYDNIWHRGLVLSFNPTMVDYIDWGTVEELSSTATDFKAIGELAKPPRFAQLIRLPQNCLDKSKDLEIDSVISVKKITVDTENGVPVINVDMLEERTTVAETATISSSSAPPTTPSITPSATPSATPATTPATTPKTTSSAKRPPSVLASITAGMNLIAEVAHVMNHRAVRVVLTFEAIAEAFESLLIPFKDDCDGNVSTMSCITYEPHVDDLVAVRKPNDDYWVRGYVLNYQPPTIEIASLDEASIITSVEKIIPLASKFSDISIFSAIMTTNSEQSLPPMEVGSVIELDVTAIKSSKSSEKDARTVVEVNMKSDQSTLITGLELNEWTPWEVESPNAEVPPTTEKPINDPAPAQNGIPASNTTTNHVKRETGTVESSSSEAKRIVQRIEFKDNIKVMIQSYRSPSLLFLRSLEPEEVQRHCTLMQNVAKSALTSPSLTALPQSAEYVLTQFVDGNFYRAMVISSDNETKQIKVVYIDYGDMQVTTLDKLRVMPDSLMNDACCVRKVKLSGIKSVPPTESAILHLATAVANEQPFVYQVQSSVKAEELVVLNSVSTGESLNDQLNYLLTPTWEREGNKSEKSPSAAAESTTPSVAEVPTSLKKLDVEDENINQWFSINDMAAGKLGNVGETVSAILLEPTQPGWKYVFGPEDAEMMVHLTSVMPEMMRKYSESTSCYVPRSGELCIARFDDGQWYRGCCFNNTYESALIFFLDFGNLSEVLHADIRKMTSDFLKPAAFGCVCITQDFIDPSTSLVTPQVLARLETLLVQNEMYKVEVVSFNGDEYQIKLPEIRAKLVEEGLLSP